MQHFFSDALGKIVDAGFLAQVLEGQDGDGGQGRGLSCWRGAQGQDGKDTGQDHGHDKAKRILGKGKLAVVRDIGRWLGWCFLIGATDRRCKAVASPWHRADIKRVRVEFHKGLAKQ